MKTETGEKAFDCVKWTRRTRDRISAEIRDMSQEELVRWFEDRRPADPFLAELFDRREAPAHRGVPTGTVSDEAWTTIRDGDLRG